MEEKRRSTRVGLVSEVQIQRTVPLPASPTGSACLPSPEGDRQAQAGLPAAPTGVDRGRAAQAGEAGEVAPPSAGHFLDKGIEVVAWGADLSEGGIGLLASSPLQVGEEVVLRIAVPGSEAPISVKGQVVWAKAAKPGLRVGVRFREVEALSGAQILQFVTERLARLPAAPSGNPPGAAQAGR